MQRTTAITLFIVFFLPYHLALCSWLGFAVAQNVITYGDHPQLGFAAEVVLSSLLYGMLFHLPLASLYILLWFKYIIKTGTFKSNMRSLKSSLPRDEMEYNMKFYRTQIREGLLDRNRGDWALISEGKLVSVTRTEEEIIEKLKQNGGSGYVVQIGHEDIPVGIYALECGYSTHGFIVDPKSITISTIGGKHHCCQFVFDTGASISVISDGTAEILRKMDESFKVTGKQPVNVAIGDSFEVDIVHITFFLDGLSKTVRVAIGNQNLLGRDILKCFTFTGYNESRLKMALID